MCIHCAPGHTMAAAQRWGWLGSWKQLSWQGGLLLGDNLMKPIEWVAETEWQDERRWHGWKRGNDKCLWPLRSTASLSPLGSHARDWTSPPTLYDTNTQRLNGVFLILLCDYHSVHDWAWVALSVPRPVLTPHLLRLVSWSWSQTGQPPRLLPSALLTSSTVPLVDNHISSTHTSLHKLFVETHSSRNTNSLFAL